MICLLLLALVTSVEGRDESKLTAGLDRLFEGREFMGMTVEVAEHSSTVYKYNRGFRDYARKLPIDNNTVFRMASLSKSPTSVGLLQLRDRGLFKLTDNIEKHLGFAVRNPFFPSSVITV